MARHNTISQEEINYIKNSVNQTSRELAAILGRHKITILKIAKSINKKLPVTSPVSLAINNSYFDTMTNETAYIVGFIAADGCILEGKRGGMSLSIGISDCDATHLLNITKRLEYTRPLRFRKKYKSVEFSVGSRQICERLKEFGIVPRKSLTLKWPRNIPTEYLPHFIRGYFDGDGTTRMRRGYIDTTGNLIPQIEFSILGTLDFLQGMKNYVNSRCNSDVGSIIYQRKFNIHKLTFGGTISAERFGDLIYHEDTIRLQRKKDVFTQWKTIKDKKLSIEEYDKILKNYQQKVLKLKYK